MLARVSDMTTAMKRATAEDYNGPKAVRDHGRVATREKNSAAGDDAEQSRPVDLVRRAIHEAGCRTQEEAFLFGTKPRPVDSGFDLPNFPKDSDGFDSRAADEVKLLVGELPGPTLDAFQKYPENSFVVSSGGAEITP